MELLQEDIQAFEQRFRTTFINSLGGFKSLALIGTINNKGNTNLAAFNSLFHLGATPALLGFVVRPDSVERHTLKNIRQMKVFTVNHVTAAFYENAHQTSARYPAEISEFSGAKLTEAFKPDFAAPFVKESSVQIGVELHEVIDIPVNGTLIVIGKIVSVTLPDHVLGSDGFVDLVRAGSVTCAGLDAYYTAVPLARLSYAKPDSWPKKIE